MSDNVHAVISVEYQGTHITKSVTVKANGETAAVNVNRAIEYATRKIQIMVQSEQGVGAGGVSVGREEQ